MPYWWEGDESERYWCEITHRPDIGADLKCPQAKVVEAEDGGIGEAAYWSYSLINLVAPGDIVFHYSGKSHEYVGASVAGGPVEERDIVWTARGSAARARPEDNSPKPGWRLPLFGFEPMGPPLALAALQRPQDLEWILQWLDDAQERWGTTCAPLMRYKDTIRGAQGYLTKMPRAFVERWPVLRDAAARMGKTQTRVESAILPSPVLPPLEDVKLEHAAELDEVLRVSVREPGSPGNGRGSGGVRRSKDSKRIGDRAEEVVFCDLQKQEQAGLIRGLRWLAREGQTPGWDIEYVNGQGDLVAVEVKGTSGDAFTSLDITAQEWAQAQARGRNYHLHLVALCLTDKPRAVVLADPWALHQSGRLLLETAVWRVRLAGPTIQPPNASSPGQLVPGLDSL